MLSDRLDACEAIANSSINLARVAPEEELAMEPIGAGRSWRSLAICAERLLRQRTGCARAILEP